MPASQPGVVCRYVGCWEAVEDQPVCIELLLPSRYLGRTIDNGKGLFAEVRIARLKTVLDANET